jgi:hypothetical protein
MDNLTVDPTPRCGCYAIIGPDGREVGTATQRDPHPTLGQGITDAEALERARLFAAAPKLLAALRELVAAINSSHPDANDIVAEAESIANAAIAKATAP